MAGRDRRRQSPLERALTALLMLVGSALPFIIAWVLVASTEPEDGNPINRLPDYGDALEETLQVPLGAAGTLRTQYEYRGPVRLILEGTAQAADGATRDAFYLFTAPDGTPLVVPRLAPTGLVLDGQPILAALGLAQSPPRYDPDHFYSMIYESGADWRRIAWGAQAGSGSGVLSVTVVQGQ